jgi:V-type H+-transporting ATPase subunit E
MESNVTVLAREKDLDIVKQSADAAAKSYNKISGQEVKVDVEGPLSNDGCVIMLHQTFPSIVTGV